VAIVDDRTGVMGENAVAAKVLRLLVPEERRTLVLLFVLMLIGMVLEAVGIGLILPILALVGGTGTETRVPLMGELLTRLGPGGGERLIVWAVVGLLAVYLLKNVFLAIFASRMVRFAYDLNVQVSQRLFRLYLSQPYTFHLQRNSAQLVNTIAVEAHFFTTAVSACLGLAAELLVLLGLLILLLLVEPLGTLYIGTAVLVAAWTFYRVANRRTEELALARQHHDEMSLQHLQQGLHAAKDVILLGREKEFLDQYYWHSRRRADAGHRHDLTQQLPRLVLEFFAVAAMGGLTLLLVAFGEPAAAVLPTLGLFAGVAFRVLPAVNRILVAFQMVRFAGPSIERLYHDFRTLARPVVEQRREPLGFQRAIEVRNVRFCYPGSDRAALEGVSLTIARGETVGIVGASGAGKSTLLDSLLGLLEPLEGAVLVDGRDLRSHARRWQAQIGYVPQSIYLTDDAIRRNVAFGIPEAEIDDDAVWRALEAAQLDGFVRGLPGGLDANVGERGVRLSGGERQRLGIARALYHDPQVLVLDEATSALDVGTEGAIMATVHRLHGSKTVIVVSHRRSALDGCDRIHQLERGRISLAMERVPATGTGM
jgi:ATP-binding cassette, subfamily B, bacterial PglK